MVYPGILASLWPAAAPEPPDSRSWPPRAGRFSTCCQSNAAISQKRLIYTIRTNKLKTEWTFYQQNLYSKHRIVRRNPWTLTLCLTPAASPSTGPAPPRTLKPGLWYPAGGTHTEFYITTASIMVSCCLSCWWIVHRSTVQYVVSLLLQCNNVFGLNLLWRRIRGSVAAKCSVASLLCECVLLVNESVLRNVTSPIIYCGCDHEKSCSYREIFQVDHDGKGHPHVLIGWHHTSSQRDNSLTHTNILDLVTKNKWAWKCRES